MLPGVAKLKAQMASTNVDDALLKRQEAIIGSMTRRERKDPMNILTASRRRRIAQGSGTEVADVNRLLKQFQQMQDAMKQMKKLGKKGFMRQMAGKLPPGMLPPGGMR
jgi:signal recognition particle subunit SRP54